MPFGPGKYDAVCTKVREEIRAKGVLIIVFDGIHGNGFSAQASLGVLANLPQILRDTAQQIEESMEQGHA